MLNDLRLSGYEFDPRPLHRSVIGTEMGDRLFIYLFIYVKTSENI